MGFWIFMLVMALLIPVTMIAFGRLFLNKPPKDINYLFGYRTKRSMMNMDTWQFAHRYIGRLWCIGGYVLLPVSVIVMILFLGKETDTVGAAGGILVFAQMIPMFGAIIPTEKALKRRFDESGRRR